MQVQGCEYLVEKLIVFDGLILSTINIRVDLVVLSERQHKRFRKMYSTLCCCYDERLHVCFCVEFVVIDNSCSMNLSDC